MRNFRWKLNGKVVAAAGAQALATVLVANTTLTRLLENEIGPVGARALAEVPTTNQTLSTLERWRSQIGAEGTTWLAWSPRRTHHSRSWASGASTSALNRAVRRPSTRTARCKYCLRGESTAPTTSRTRARPFSRQQITRRVELWDDALVLRSALSARVAVLLFGDELLDLKLQACNVFESDSSAG